MCLALESLILWSQTNRVNDYKHYSMTTPLFSPHEHIPSFKVLATCEWRLGQRDNF